MYLKEDATILEGSEIANPTSNPRNRSGTDLWHTYQLSPTYLNLRHKFLQRGRKKIVPKQRQLRPNKHHQNKNNSEKNHMQKMQIQRPARRGLHLFSFNTFLSERLELRFPFVEEHLTLRRLTSRLQPMAHPYCCGSLHCSTNSCFVAAPFHCCCCFSCLLLHFL